MNDGHATGRSKQYSKLLQVFKAHFDDRLESDGLLDLYRVTLDDEDVDALAHWRKASHDAHKNVIIMVVRRVLGPGARDWVRDWFSKNDPLWLSLSELVDKGE